MNNSRAIAVIALLLILSSTIASAYIVDPASTGFGSQNRTENGKNMTGQWLGNNATLIIPINGQYYLVAPWFSNADTTILNSTYLHSFQNGSWTRNATSFPMVTDEFTRAAYNLVQYQNNDTIADAIINTIIYINDSGNTYTNGHTGSVDIEWVVRVNQTASGWNIYKDQVADTASDAGAYAMLTLAHINQSGSYNATNSNRAGERLALMCPVFANNSYLDVASLNLKNRVNPSQTFSHAPCGGSNVCSGMSSTDLTYQAYDGPMLEALAACKKLIGDTGSFNYTNLAEDQFQFRLVAANWTSVSAPLGPGRAYKYANASSGGTPSAVCTNSCTNASGSTLGTEYPDSMRGPDICRAAWVWSNLTGHTLQNSTLACEKYASVACLTNTTFGYQMDYNAVSYGSCTDSGFRAVGLGMSLFFTHNSTQFSSLITQYNSHYGTCSGGFCEMDSQNGFGIYDKSFGLTDMAYAYGIVDNSFTSQAISNAAPVIVASTINSTTNTSASDLFLYCQATDAENGPISYAYTVYKNGILNTSGSSPAQFTSCYQESSNNNTNGCGQSTGAYSNDERHFYINYTKPPGAQNTTVWQVSHGEFGPYNLTVPYIPSYNATIPSSCWNYNSQKLVLRFYAFHNNTAGSSEQTYSIGQCFDGTTWVNATNKSNITDSAGIAGMSGSDTYWYDANIATGCYLETVSGQSPLCGTTSSDGQSSGLRGLIKSTLWEEGIHWNISTSYENQTRNVVNISAAGLAKGQNWTLTCQANDTMNLSAPLNSSTFTIQNIAPNVTDVFVTNPGAYVNCTYIYNDTDGDLESGTAYRWFRNSTLLVPTSRTINSGNYSVGDSLICEVRANDSTDFGIRTNSSTFVVGDAIAPTIANLTVPSDGTIADALTIIASCTDTNTLASGSPKVQWTNPNGIVEGNFSMTLNSGTGLYEKTYTFSIVGAYTDFIFACADGSGNLATSNPPTILTIATSNSGGGGGGGGGNSGSASCSGFSLLKPRPGTQATNPYCPPGGTSSDIDIDVYNTGLTTQTFTVTPPAGRCAVTPALTVAGNTQATITLEDCACPTEKGKIDEFTVIVAQNGACTQSFEVRLTARTFLPGIENPADLAIFGGGLMLLGLFFIIIVTAIVKRRRTR